MEELLVEILMAETPNHTQGVEMVDSDSDGDDIEEVHLCDVGQGLVCS